MTVNFQTPLAALVALPMLAAPALANEGLSESFDALLAGAYEKGEPGAAVIVIDEGEVLYRGARGMANLELGVALEPDMVFRLASITKQFTCAAILLLEERGKLSVFDPITLYLPDYPVQGHVITIEHLMTHTSGIFNYTGIPGYMAERVRLDLSTDELIDEFKGQAMDFAPGEQHSYSNSGYVLLGAIIERVSGESYADFVRTNIFEPLGMQSSSYEDQQLVPRRVAGYSWDWNAQSYANAPFLSMTQPHAAGSLLSTVDDLARWDAALYGDELLSAASRQRMFTAATLNSGEATSYGYGFGIGSFHGTRAISHSGGIFGFSTYAIRLPEEGVYVAVLSNGATADPSMLARRAAALAMGKPIPGGRTVDVAPEVLERYVGVYRIDDDNTRAVTVEDGRLFTTRTGGEPLEAFPHSETGFYYENFLAHFEFALDAEGIVTHMLMYQEGADVPGMAVKVDG